jgi:phage regulator Rha-like protein
MNELSLRNQRMTSLEIAEVTGKQHKNVMQSIRNMEESWAKVTGLKFQLSEYSDVTGRTLPCYLLNKTECLYIATKFNDEARAKLVLRWEQLEKERIMQGAVRHLLVTDSDIMNEAERIVGRQLTSCNQHADGCLTATDIAKLIGIDTKDLNSFLCDKGIQKWGRGQFRLTPEYEGRGLAQDRLFIYYSKEGKQRERTYLVWTQKGADFISNLVN